MKKEKTNTNQELKLGKVILLVVIIAIAVVCGFLVSNTSGKTYNVSFDAGNGTSNTLIEVEGKNKVTKPADPTREGYTFDGWYIGDEEFNFDTAISEDITLKAKWTKVEETENAVTYTVIFDSKGGSDVKSQTVESGKAAAEPTKPTRKGYTFAGWYNGNVKYNFASKVTANITLIAKWTKVEENKDDNKTETVTKYTVTFDSKGGSAVSSKTVEEGKTVQKPADPTRKDYTFKGWYLGETEYNFNAKVTGNITLTAKWEKIEEPVVETKKYTVTFDSKGGSAVSSKTVEEGKTVQKPTDPTRAGYTFKGWYLGETEYNFNAKVTGDITLIAEWEKDDVITWGKVEVTGGMFKQERIFIYKNGVPVAGIADFVDSTGAVVRKNVPATGKLEPAGSVANLKNITVN